jgi:hypothetical protein
VIDHRPTRVRTQIIFSMVMGFVLSWVVMVGMLVAEPATCRGAAQYTTEKTATYDHMVAGNREYVGPGRSEGNTVRFVTYDEHWIFCPSRTTPPHLVTRYSAGFPARMAYFDIVPLALNDGGYSARGLLRRQFLGAHPLVLPRIAPAHRFVPGSTPLRLIHIGIPCRPIWTGLGINTAFYGAIFWFIWFAPRYVRRWMRVRKRRCALCNYPRGDSDYCSECGQNVKRIRHAPAPV